MTIIFVCHRSKKNEWLAILSTDLTLTAQDILRNYRMRWDIEVLFKCTKSLLRLQKEFQGRSYDLLVSHTTIVFSRYILLAWQHRQSTDQRSFGGLFYLLCDEVGTIDWAVARQQLVDMINEIVSRAGDNNYSTSITAMDRWFAQLHQGISAYFMLRKLS